MIDCQIFVPKALPVIHYLRYRRTIITLCNYVFNSTAAPNGFILLIIDNRQAISIILTEPFPCLRIIGFYTLHPQSANRIEVVSILRLLAIVTKRAVIAFVRERGFNTLRICYPVKNTHNVSRRFTVYSDCILK